MEELVKKLLKIQQQLKAPKSEYNSFAGFDYRSAEKILESVKPLVHKEGLVLLLSDGTKVTGEWNYVVATAILWDGKNEIKVTAEAREQETKKGMDTAQITGAASSYARKYALSGMFAIDDTEDPDAHDNTPQAPKKAYRARPDEPASDKQRGLIKTLLERQSVSIAEMPAYLEAHYGIIPGAQMLKTDATNIIKELMEDK